MVPAIFRKSALDLADIFCQKAGIALKCVADVPERNTGACRTTMKIHHSLLGRRDFIRIGGLTSLGLVSGLGGSLRAAEKQPPAGRAKSCILIWLDGGPSHLETFDLKPNAPAEVRGPFSTINTATPGISICEHLPQLAKRMNKLAVVRSVTSPLGEHNLAANYLLTGYQPTPAVAYPTVGAVLSSQRSEPAILPANIAVPSFRVGGGKMTGEGYLSSAHRPFSVGGDPSKADFRVANLDFYPGVDRDRVEQRRRFLGAWEGFAKAADALPEHPTDASFEAAYRLATSASARAAFDLKAETAQTRARYGGKAIGQSCLLARRLVERGVQFVTVNNTGWDTHKDAYTRLKEGFTGARTPVGLIPSLDQAASALLDDLANSGRLDETLVLIMGEFGRTPKINVTGGRDHWPRVFSVALAGGGIKGGQVIGSSDRTGESPLDRPVTPADLAATIYQTLGVDPQKTLQTADGRPIRISPGKVIPELLG